MGQLPVDHWEDVGGWPRRPRVTHRPNGDVLVEIPTETGNLAYMEIERRRGYPLEHDEYTFNFTGELVDVAPEGLTAVVQLAFLALRENRRMELDVAKVVTGL